MTKPAAPAAPSLLEFDAAEKAAKVKQCWMCAIPERAEAEAAVTAGLVGKSAVLRWLKDRYGDQATSNKVDAHFRDHVRP